MNKVIFFIVFLFSTNVFSGELYESGVHKWPYKKNQLALISGLSVENDRYYYFNYSFYILKKQNGKEIWYSVPIMKDKDSTKWDFRFNTWSGFSEVMLKNAKVVVKGSDIFIISADKSDNDSFQNVHGPASLLIYKLQEGNEMSRWRYYFALIENKIIPADQAGHVDEIITRFEKKLLAE
ncbi:hypothetical protein [Iodobacter ciconiae]|uniref:Uncharacterized protein n=1 Tax=Iodobacter ciconiae TaxID=2496266 RepID=A0A3S8ZPC4_9NEIS|nr:hypothetical protein [Iodobacter ciconiae]AZN35326.1 hypothetical protein EJO50_01765 [Iodobacter ciconiae]